MRYILFIVSCFFTLTACTPLQQPKDQSSDQVIATVNKQTISAEQLQKRLEQTSENKTPSSIDEIPSDKKEEILQQIIEEELVLQSALDTGLLQNSVRLRREIMREYFQDRFNQTTKPSEEEIRQTYEHQKDKLDRVMVKHILLPTKKEAISVLNRYNLNPTKKNFAALATTHSIDQSTKESGGDIKWFMYDEMVPEFSNAAFSISNVGEVVGPIKTEFGYHLIYLAGDKRGFEKHKGSIQIHLAKINQTRLRKEILQDLRKQAQIQVAKTNTNSIGKGVDG
ncbi:MAG: peptidylprolyl isomerase [Deltaproteobacteria bacterium]|nr:peptidylprolyl isomerase [Deltaproteobacteria bacterium]